MADAEIVEVSEEDGDAPASPPPAAKPPSVREFCDAIHTLAPRSRGGVAFDPFDHAGRDVARERDRALKALIARIGRIAEADIVDAAFDGEIYP